MKGGVSIDGLMIRHEAPRLLTAPKEEKRVEKEKPDAIPTFNAFPVLAAILGVLGAVLAVFGYIFITAVQLDPAIIAVLPDGTWLEVLTWYD